MTNTELDNKITDIDQCVMLAIAQHHAGELANAERLYRSILQVEPCHPEVNHNLGVLLVLMQQAAAGLPYCLAALDAEPERGQYWLSYIDALFQSGQDETAREVLLLAQQQGLQGTEAFTEKYFPVDTLETHAGPGKAHAVPPASKTKNIKLAKGASPGPDEINELVSLFSAGQYIQAEQIAREMTLRFPRHGFGWMVLGAVLKQQGRSAEALKYLQKAVSLSPKDSAAHSNLGVTLQELGRLKEAEASHRRALFLDANSAQVHHNLGITLQSMGKKKAAEACYRNALRIKPDLADALSNMGLILQEKGHLEEAEECHRRAVKITPDSAIAHCNLAIILQSMGRQGESEASYREAIRINPDYVEAYYNLAIALHQQARMDEAEACYQRVLEIRPGYVGAHYNLGKIYQDSWRMELAEASYRQELQINPDCADAYNNLGLILQSQGKIDEAEACFRRVLQFKPDYAEAHSSIGSIMLSIGKVEEAKLCFRQALDIRPDMASVRSNLIFGMDLSDKVDFVQGQQERQRWEEMHAVPLWQEPVHSNELSPFRRLRVGYISADFRNHSAVKAFGGMLTCYDRAQFEVFAYSNHSGKEDQVTDLFKKSVTAWRNIADLSDENVVKMIQEDRVDILVDLSGHSAGNRLLVFARKPAPIQISAWGYASGTGMRAMDVLFSDRVMIPPEDRQYFAEEVRYLPCALGSFFVDKFPGVNGLPALTDSILTFGSLNRLVKITDATYRAWIEILRSIPQSRLIMKSPELDEASVRTRVLEHFTGAGIAAERIILVGKTSWHEHVRTFNRIDIGLDPFPHGGGVTALEGLMMGIPVITLRWPSLAGRVSASIMTTLGLTEWIAETEGQYIELAVQKAADLQSLSELRARLRDIFTTSVIGDPVVYARVVEHEYRKLWQDWCVSRGVDLSNFAVPEAVEERREFMPGLEEISKLVAVFTAGQYIDTEVIAREMTQRFSWYGFGWKVLGAALKQQGKSAEALDVMHKAVGLLPDDAGVHSNLGMIYQGLGRLNEAVASLNHALVLEPDLAEAHSNLGLTLYDMGRLDDAVSSYRLALQITPDSMEVHYNLGITLKGLGRINEAVASYQRALEINPDRADINYEIGNLLLDIGLTDEAKRCFRQAIELVPDFVLAHSALIFCMDLSNNVDLSESRMERNKWEKVHAAPLWEDPVHANDRSPSRRLRIGYVSADFKEHSAPKSFGGLLTRFDPAQFEVFAYSNFKAEENAALDLLKQSVGGLFKQDMTDLFRKSVTVWRNIFDLSDEDIANLIREDQIDILVDLSGHSGGNRLLVFARKPAPIQISAWGYASGTGMRAMDVLFSDRVMIPPEDRQYFAEEVRYLPCALGSFFVDKFPDVNELPALSEGIITFGSLNRLAKVTDITYRAWAEVLKSVPQSRLIMKTPELDDASARVRVTAHFTEAGVSAERVILMGKTSWYGHMKVFNQIDIGLDPFPHGGGVTALEGLMMGIPVITLRWPSPAGRVSASIMTTMGLTDWIAETEMQYVELAAKKAGDLQSLSHLRKELRTTFTSSVIGDQVAYTRAVEQEYRTLWQEWCADTLLK